MTPSERDLRRRAYLAVRRALRTGVLDRQPCEVCGDPLSEAHHRWGYTDPLRIAWLCAIHHEDDHRRMHVERGFVRYQEPRHWQYSENTGPNIVLTHIDRLIGLLTDHERERALRRIQAHVERQRMAAA